MPKPAHEKKNVRMARIRSVKPEVFLHEGLFDLEQETKLPIRLAWIGLWTQCDREGRFRWRARELKAAILPHDQIDFSRVLDALLTAGLVCLYVSSNEKYGFIPTWKRHQTVNNRESASVLPDPHSNDCQITTSTGTARVNHARGTPALGEGEGEGEVEGKGKRQETPLPPLPENLDRPDFRNTLSEWLAYKAGKRQSYKEQGLRAMVTQASHRVEQHGMPAVLEAFTKAMANGWDGWDQTSSFAGNGRPTNDPHGNLAARARYLNSLEADDG